MSIAGLLIAAIAVLPAFGLAAWAWLAIASANDDLSSFVGIEGMRFDE